MLIAVIAAIVLLAVAVAVALAVARLRRNTRLDEVDRFHVARTLTTKWATQPPADVRVPDQGTVAGD